MVQSKITSPVLIKELREIAGLTDEEIDLYISFLVKKTIKKKDHLLMAGDVSTAVAYVNKGCLRRYIIDDHSKEIILNFALEDYWIGDLESLIFQKPTIYYIQALEESELLLLSRKNLFRANEEIPKFKIFHDDKVQRNHYYALKRLSVAKSATPEEKYLFLMKEQPQLFQRIPQHYIAAYLGIEPESLSRLRKRIVIKPAIS
ncbi:MAG: Crp/Fnr family transcriptional regulator [Ignavibacteriaceae bacterium]|jgi:CRP-like cAMP-binding protein|nr:Crp/Fnr family transcriptional regulator [Chlorobium sp.]MCW9095771.1 Crp/Fnr family transcriptional regulator [Ignavibacteriaceae bacterium]